MQERKYSIAEFVDDDWDLFVRHPLQTSMFAKYYADKNGSVPVYIRVLEDDKVVAQLLCFINGVGASWLANFPLGKIINKVSRNVFSVATFFQASNISKKDLDNIQVMMKLHYSINKMQGSFTDKVEGLENKWATYIIDLSKTEEELLASMDKKARKAIRHNQDLIKVHPSNDEGVLKMYEQMLKRTRKELGINYLPPAYPDKSMADLFGTSCQVFVAECNGKITTMSGVLAFGDYVIDLGIAVEKDESISAGKVLKWEVMKWAKNKGIKYYDLAGVVPNDQQGDKKELAIKFFKSRFGGEYKEYSILK